MPSDQELLDAWAEGDTRAGEELFHRHFESLYRFFRNKTDEGIDDLVQDSFLGCLEGRAQLRGEATFRTYLFVVARNRLYDHWQKRRRESGDVDIGSFSVERLSTSPTGKLARHEDHQQLLRALRALPLDLQVALELYYWEDLSGPELSGVLGVPEGTVRSRLRRAREELLAKVQDLGVGRAATHLGPDALDAWAREVRGLAGGAA